MKLSTAKTFAKTSLLAFGLLGATSFAISAAEKTAPTDAPAMTQSVETLIASGTFSGLSDHETVGDVRLVQTATGYELILERNFELDGAPDPVVGFGTSGTYLPASQVADLTSKKGTQTYKLPANFTPADFNEVYIWCERFSVPLGVATLS